MAIGPNCHWCSEEEFCDYTGCRPGNLEDWLSQDWIQHFPHLILSFEDVPGPIPWVLYRTRGQEHTVRVFSASPELAGWLNCDREERKVVVQ